MANRKYQNFCVVCLFQTDKEFEETYLTYREIDHGNYTKVFDANQYSADIPDTVDWRTSNAVTGIKNQVYHKHLI